MENDRESQTHADTMNDLERRFTYHAPKDGQPVLYASLRNQAKALAVTISDSQPNSRERAMAITKLEEAIAWANAGIARNT